MEPEPGDEYVRRTAEYIRSHEAGLAAAVPLRRRPAKAPPSSEVSVFNPLGWFSYDPSAVANAKPVILTFDFHHLFYLLMRMEALGFDVGSLDIKVDNPSRPMNYIALPTTHGDRSDALSFVSLRSSLSAVSRLSLGAGWFGRPVPPSLDAELRYIFRSFSVLPALSLHAPEPKLIAELAKDSPIENALPLQAFKNLQTLQCIDIDPRTVLGWDNLSRSLRSLTVKRSGLEDVSDIFIGAVKDDQARREGRVSALKSRQFSRGISRRSSLHSTKLPESVPEDVEEDDADSHVPLTDTPKPPPSPELPPSCWSLLRHLCLADNALTFLPTTFLSYLTSVTHLDLSSNLLVSVPPGLSALYNLVYLNLSDNMIDTVLGIYTNLGGVVTLNLSHNRLESICGLERLYALERVDLRDNIIEESAEVGRLATLPNIAEVSVEGNPLVEIEEGYRIRCFDYFSKEKKSILLDGSPPGFYEKRYLTSPPPEQMTSTRPPSVAASPPVVAVGGPSRLNGVIHAQSSPIHASPNSSPASYPSHPASPLLAAGQVRGRKRKNKRIVDLDGGQEASDVASVKSVPRTVTSRTKSPIKRNAAPAPMPTSVPKAERSPAPTPTLLALTQPRAPPIAFSPPPVQPTAVVKPKSRHSRHMTEFTPSPADDAFAPLPEGQLPGLPHRKSSTLTRSQARRARMSASVYEPGADGGRREGGGAQFESEADAFRARIEALRSDMGEGWLKVFNQSQIVGSPPRASS
ncbi:hypothetical protein GSI_01522 [Ganoderma sinense ZZ0214-1]|uniref:Uncharacterized protein n=1 Tax=Ganoderma sinense ZZ0214-1 TaxID=1077348 RepID=A0A2G8SQ39_9APHY|nr:hypothetical protein GSI_01522 [Ganoderma sinense ZZ0214-1]